MADNYVVNITLSGKDQVSGTFQKLNAEIDKTQRNARELNNTGENTSSMFNRMRSDVLGAVSAYGAMRVVQQIGEMSELGTQIGVTSANFRSLTADIGGQESVLRAMREATHGVLTDYELMGAANQFLALGLAENSDEMARMTERAIQLGGAVGTGPVEAIETLQRALRNQSFEMLDSLGVSAANVRARIKELTEAGMEMSEAFRQATLEQLDAGVERLGESADAAFTPVDRLAARLENLYNQAAGNVAAGVQGIANAADVALTMLEQQQSEQVINDARLNETAAELARRFQASFESELDDEFIVGFIRRSLEALENDPALSQFESYTDILAELGQVAPGNRHMLTDTDMGANLSELLSFVQQQRVEMQMAAELGERLRAQDEQRLQIQQQIVDFRQAEANAARQQLAQQPFDDYFNLIEERAQGVWDTFRSHNGSGFFTQEDTVGLDNAINDANTFLERMEELAENDLIDDSQLENARLIAENMTRYADEIERGAQAFASMNFGELLGQQGGGRLGEFQDMVLSGLDLPEQDLAKIQETFDLASGRETTLSQTLQGDVVPLLQEMITNDQTAEAVTLMQTILGEIETQRMAGLSPDQINANLQSGLMAGGAGTPRGPEGAEGGAGAFDIGSFTEAFTVMDTAAMNIATNTTTIQSDMATAAVQSDLLRASMGEMTTTAPEVAVAAGEMATRFGEAETRTISIQSVIAALTEEIHDIRLRIRLSGDVDLLRAVVGATNDMGGSAAVFNN